MKPPKYLILVIVILALVVLVYLLFIQKKNKELISSKEIKTDSQPLMIDGRLLVGVIPPEVNKAKIIYTNKIAPDWVTLLKKNIMNFSEDLFKEVEVVPEKSYILYENGAAKYVDNVLIRITKKDGLKSSYRAQVDSATGEVLKTWDKTIFEDVGRAHNPQHQIEVHEEGMKD